MSASRPLRAVDTGEPEIGHAPPHDIAAEQVVLGAAMLSPAALAETRDLLDTGDFYRGAHARIWEAITALADRGAPHDPLAVGRELGRDITKAGGGGYLHTLITTVPTAVQAGYYAQLVRTRAYARRVTEAGLRLTQAATDPDTVDLRATVTGELTALTTIEARGWPEPTPLSSTPAGGLPPFPLWALPSWLGDYTAALAETTQTPADLPGCLALAVLSVAAAGKIQVQAPTWREPTCLFIVVALPPGNRKSEVYKSMCAPIHAAETALIAAAEPIIAEAVINRRIAEAHAEKTAKTTETTDLTQRTTALAEATDAKLALDNATIPPRPRLFSDDATVEKLTGLLAEHDGRMAVLSPEGEIFSIAAGRYSGTPNFAVLKKGHAGEEIRVDRLGRESESIDAATVTLGICTQPAVLAELGDTPQFRGQGLLGRILYSTPKSLLGTRTPNPDPMPAHLETDYHTTLKSLILSLADLPQPATLHFTDKAAGLVTDLLGDIEPRLGPTGDLAHMTDWGGKLAGATIRIAGLLHLAQHLRDGWNHPITEATLAAALDITDYYTHHAKTAYDTIGADPTIADARAILDWIRNTGALRFTGRDVQPPLRARFRKVADLDPALRILETHGWIRRLPQPPRGRGRPAAPTYEVHPTALDTPR